MAVTKSVGYPGPITGTDLSYWVESLGRQYDIDAPGDWRVASLSNGQLQAVVAAGTGAGRGVRDTSTDTTVTFDPQVSQGIRYDLVVARRTWGSTKATTFAVVKGGATPEGVFALRNKNPGVIDDQPLAVVPIAQGSSNPGTPIDVRVWQANGHAVANDDLVLQYLNDAGTSILIDGVEWYRIVMEDGSTAGWQTHTLGTIPMLGTGLALGNGEALSSPPPANARFRLQSGTTVQNTDQSGYARITWPVLYTGGLHIWKPWIADDSASPDATANPAGLPWHIGNRAEGLYRVWGGGGFGGAPRSPLVSHRHRVSWFAIGWM